jgi:hypothetical protein
MIFIVFMVMTAWALLAVHALSTAAPPVREWLKRQAELRQAERRTHEYRRQVQRRRASGVEERAALRRRLMSPR